jgi:hypothetical protein
MAKRKRTITDLQNTTQKTIISPTAIYFFTGNKSDFYFLDILCSFSLMLRAYQRSKKYQFVKSLVWPDRGSNPRSTALEASTPTIMPPMRFALYEAAWTRPRYTFMSLRGQPFNLLYKLIFFASLVSTQH